MNNVQAQLDSKLIEKQKEKRKKVRSGLMNPSSFGQCFRRQYWNRLNVVETDPPDIHGLRIFEAGNWNHVGFQSLFSPTQCEVELTTDDVHGFADIVEDDGVTDLKTINSFQFTKFKKMTADQIEKEKPDYLLQIMTYADHFKKKYGRLVFINKETLETIEFVFETAKWHDRVHAEIDQNRNYWIKQELPTASPRLYKQKDGTFKECQYCGFCSKCEIQEGKKAF